MRRRLLGRKRAEAKVVSGTYGLYKEESIVIILYLIL
jgi:hypothetical protein